MKDRIHEQLSALVDDELAHEEQALLIRQLCADDELQKRFGRYQLVSDVLGNHAPARLDNRFHARMQAALQQETEIHAAPARNFRWQRPLAGLALAASVAVVAVVSLQNIQPDGQGEVQSIASAASPGDYIRAENISNVSAPVAQTPAARGLDIYLVNHNEYAVSSGVQGMLPYVRLVGQDMQPEESEAVK